MMKSEQWWVARLTIIKETTDKNKFTYPAKIRKQSVSTLTPML